MLRALRKKDIHLNAIENYVEVKDEKKEKELEKRISKIEKNKK